MGDDLFYESFIPGVGLFSFPSGESQSPVLESSKLPLGKHVEAVFSQRIMESDTYDLIAENIQIQHEGRTLGELDFILQEKSSKKMIHVELVYKFYVFKDEMGESELAKWIGPNAKDKLEFKMKKLSSHQFPLLRHSATLPYLKKLGLDVDRIEQELCFMGELYLPHSSSQSSFSSLSPMAINGVWYSYSDFSELKSYDLEFHVCAKPEWLLPSISESWYDQESACTKVKESLSQGRSPMVWIRENSKTRRCFVLGDDWKELL